MNRRHAIATILVGLAVPAKPWKKLKPPPRAPRQVVRMPEPSPPPHPILWAHDPESPHVKMADRFAQALAEKIDRMWA